MRPIKLLLTAFGPYKNKEKIDFTELAEHNLFVISGKTGSGKTTIFDGISFALYGSASGEDRENVTMLRSQFADDELHTAVEFIFELKNRRYRVLRQIGHIKRGNKTKTGEKYEFYELTETGEIPRVDRQIVSEINKKIEELIGLTQEQFKQIVMLPQGEFRKFLTSETENKEAILRRLFKTEPYQEIEVKLKEKQDKLKEIHTKDIQQLDSLTKNIVATLPERTESVLLQLLKEGTYNTHQVLTGLVDESKYYTKKIIEDKKNYITASENHEKEFKRLTEAKSINEQFNKREILLKEKENLESKQTEHLLNENRLNKATKASQLIPYEANLEDTKNELQLKNSDLIKTKELNKINNEKLTEATANYEKVKEKEQERDQIKIHIDTLNRYIPIVKESKSLLKNIELERQTVINYKRKLEQITKEQKNNEQSLDNIIEEIEQNDRDIQVLPSKELEKKELQNEWKKLNEYEKLIKELNLVEIDYKNEQKSFQKIQETYNLAEQSWLNNEAAFIATHLHEGKPCQVCGSTTHPNKAKFKEDVLSEKELQELKSLRDKHQERIQRLDVTIEQKIKEKNERENDLTELGYNSQEITEEKARITIKGQTIAEQIKILVTKQTTQKELITKRKVLREKIAIAKKEIETLSTKVDDLRSQFTEKEALYKAKINSVPEQYREVDFIESEIIRVNKLKTKLDLEWNKADENLKNANHAFLTSTTNLTQLTNQVLEINKRLSKAENTFNQILNDSEFLSIEDYKEAKLSEEVKKELKLKVDAYNKTYTELTRDLQQLNEELKDEEKINIISLEEEVNELKKMSQLLYNNLRDSERALDDTENLMKHIKEIQELVQKNEEALNILTDLYDITRGHNERKISFERFLQIEYLEQIIHAANIRLIQLSNGQFNLILSDRQETHGRQSGLALDVNDAYTGQTRDVKTLSGGEKFNASLALALGMSDVIQSFEGNISINMMFIDEGFGSLDEESLIKAIDTLIDLQKSGRLIGVISHVEELKAVFPAVLEVKKTKEGYSETKFKIK